MTAPKERDGRHGDLRFRPGQMPPLFGDTAAVLIVDDDEHAATILTLALEPEGYECTVVTNAAAARARLAERGLAGALVDVMMPGGSGLQVGEDPRGEG